jgi:hypothetical protein
MVQGLTWALIVQSADQGMSSLPCSRKSASGPYPEPALFNSHIQNLNTPHIIFPSKPVSQVISSQVFQPKLCINFLFPPMDTKCALHFIKLTILQGEYILWNFIHYVSFSSILLLSLS